MTPAMTKFFCLVLVYQEIWLDCFKIQESSYELHTLLKGGVNLPKIWP